MTKFEASCLTVLASMSICFAASDPVSDTKTEGETEITTVKRDGKTVLAVIRFKAKPSQKEIVTQTVLVDEAEIVSVSDAAGAPSFKVCPNVPVSVHLLCTTTGQISEIMLMDKELHIVEFYQVKNGKVVPVSGAVLDRHRKTNRDTKESMEGMDGLSDEKVRTTIDDLLKKQKK